MTAVPVPWRRARPLLGTLVTIQLPVAADRAAEQAFAVIAAIERAMSAHRPESDLARLAHAQAARPLILDAHTVAVLRLAQVWTRESGGAFDPQQAGVRLARLGLRPALRADAAGSLRGLRFLDETTVLPPGPLSLDLGGIAKGYAVDQAVAVLRAAGVPGGVVNAGGDMRAFGPREWAVEVRHPAVPARTQRLLRLREGAVATSVAAGNREFVRTRRHPAAWEQATVLARDCATADALTKWALQDPHPSLALRMALRRSGAQMWRS